MARITPAGVVGVSLTEYLDQLLDGVGAAVAAETGQEMSRDPESAQVVLLRAISFVLTRLDESVVRQSGGFNPSRMIGQQLDDYAVHFGLVRRAGYPSRVALTLSGIPGAVVPAGTRFLSVDEEVFATVSEVTLPPDGVLPDVAAESASLGPVTALAGEIDRFQDLIPGLDSVTNPDPAEPGAIQELDAAFRRRIETARDRNAAGTIAALRGRLLGVPDVMDALVIENRTSAPTTIRGVTIAAGAVAALVRGGADADVAEALYLGSVPGQAFSGSRALEYMPDSAPLGSVAVRWTPVTEIPVKVSLTISVRPGFQAGGIDLIRQNIYDWWAGNWDPLDGAFLTGGVGIGVLPLEQHVLVPALQVMGTTVTQLQILKKSDSTVIASVDLNEVLTLALADVSVTVQ